MAKLDLITGFLGAGKTTFLTHYVPFLAAKGERIAVLVYDHGTVNVDLPLLREKCGDCCDLEMVASAADADCLRRRFHAKLVFLGMGGYDRVIIEPSGVFDMDEYFDFLGESPLDRFYTPGNVICVLDAMLGADIPPEADFYLASQAADAGCVVLSRTQLASPEETAGTLRRLEEAGRKIRCSVPLTDHVLARNWEELTEEDLEMLAGCGYRPADYMKTIAGQGSAFQTISFLEPAAGKRELEEKTAQLFADPRFGHVLRVKGFIREDGTWYKINSDGKRLSAEPAEASQRVLIIIGTGLDEAAIRSWIQ